MTTAKIFAEMRDSDQIRADMKKSIEERAYKQLSRDSWGMLEDTGIKGALNDIYRRLFENGWFQKDIFDGRYQSDTQQLGTTYDQRASFHQLDKPQEQERDRDEDVER